MTPVQEAKRYIDNAKEILRDKARKEEGYYQDAKYVKLAGHAAYTGILVALDGLLGKKGKGRKDVDWYKQNLAKLDKRMLNSFVSAYDILHLSMAYDGIPDAEVAQTGLKRAESIIDWVEQRTVTA
ncbi:DUF5618 family protein [Spirosoma validum]|uniref:DUF5618 family protein n=1 Tax=Spirosoma validum TaxID=2771355 RepID=A0A927B8X0_9BACT|nr:DUF5618 family protein [Spirosoma validum]MBD2757413.1 DUF5618 family protein [Spirosoma validum]